MKRVLITGANSYVGTNVEKWLMREPDKYYVETLDMKDPLWKEFDFSNFDVVFHVAGIAHVSSRKNMKDLYYKVNRDLVIETANISKKSGVKQFIFMSSMIVYNSKETVITRETKPNPDNFYGQSKLDAEEHLQNLSNPIFKVSILRPPMIYGVESKGNFPKLVNFAKKTIIFPQYNNKRSLLFIENLAIYIRILIDNPLTGIFFPKNHETLSTSEIVKIISSIKNRHIWFTKLFNPLISLFKRTSSIINKIFGDYYYEIEEQDLKGVDLIDTKSSIEMIEGKTYE